MKLIKLYGVLFLLTITTTLIAQERPLPEQYWDDGGHPPIVPPGSVYNYSIWHITNNTECEFDMTFFIGVDNDVKLFFVDHSESDLTTERVATEFGIYPPNLSITHSAITIEINGQVIGSAFPGDDIDIENTNLSPPCNCVHVNFNRTTQIITLSPCL